LAFAGFVQVPVVVKTWTSTAPGWPETHGRLLTRRRRPPR
jgi:hypothetical protein